MLLLTKALLQIPTLLNNVQANRHLLWILQEWGPSWDCTWETGYWPLKLGLRGWESLPLRSSKTFCKPFQNCIVSHSFTFLLALKLLLTERYAPESFWYRYTDTLFRQSLCEKVKAVRHHWQNEHLQLLWWYFG